MDRFDDLLASSRNALEDNPFADPFAQGRSASPDPWASFQESSHDQIDYFKSGFADQHSVTSTDEQYATPIDQNAAVDPLDAAARTADDHEEEKVPHTSSTETETDTTSHKPGFGIFTSSVDNGPREVEEPDPPSRKLSDSSVHSGLAEGVSDAQPLLSSQNQASSSQEQSPTAERTITSPLERPSSPGLSQTFSGVVLRDDAHDGWQSSWENSRHVPTFTSIASAAATTTEDDDDDDTPIGQTAKFRNSAERAGLIQVCALVNQHSSSLTVFSHLSRLHPQHVVMAPFHRCL